MMAFVGSKGLSASWFSEGNSHFVGRPLVFVLLFIMGLTIGETGIMGVWDCSTPVFQLRSTNSIIEQLHP
jgi:hypothetical protein